jgi:hypothetical protein
MESNDIFWSIICFDAVINHIAHGYYFSDWYDVRRQMSVFSPSDLSMFKEVYLGRETFKEFIAQLFFNSDTLKEMVSQFKQVKHVRIDTQYGPCKMMCDAYIETHRHLTTMHPLPPLPLEFFALTHAEMMQWIQSAYVGPYSEAHALLGTLPEWLSPVNSGSRLLDYQFLMEGRGNIVDSQGNVVGSWALRLDLGPFFKPCRCWG